MEKVKSEKPFYKKWWVILLAVIIIAGALGRDEEPVKGTTSKPKVQVDKKKQQQQLVVEFEKQIYAAGEIADPAVESFEKAMIDYEKGNADVSKAYDATSKAKDAADVVYTTMMGVEIPGNLPDDVQDILDEAKEAIRASYFVKKEGLEATLEFLDNKKSDGLQEAKENFKQSETFMRNGSAKFLEAKQKVGIEVK